MKQKKVKFQYQKVRNLMIKEKITALVKKDDKANKKKIENLVFAIIVLLVTLYAINNIFKGKENQNVSNNIRTQEAEEKTKQI